MGQSARKLSRERVPEVFLECQKKIEINITFRPMREACSILQRFAHGGVEVDHSACKVMLGEGQKQRPIQVNNCVVADSSLPLSMPTQISNIDFDTSSSNALIELTVQSKIDAGDIVTVDVNLELIRDILETGETPSNVNGSF